MSFFTGRITDNFIASGHLESEANLAHSPNQRLELATIRHRRHRPLWGVPATPGGGHPIRGDTASAPRSDIPGRAALDTSDLHHRRDRHGPAADRIGASHS